MALFVVESAGAGVGGRVVLVCCGEIRDGAVSTTYRLVKWNRNKRVYDAWVTGGVIGYLGLFIAVGRLLRSGDERLGDEVLVLRALGTCALVMLHAVLAIGPLARLNPRLLPLVYNRRHLGIATFLVAAAHGVLAVGYYHGFGVFSPWTSLLTSNTNYGSWRAFPFEILGLAALGILWVMAVSSHDFWQKALGPSFWKGLHMAVYPAYVLAVFHVGLGALQTERSPLYPTLLGAGATTLAGLHLATAWRERRRDQAGGATPVLEPSVGDDAWIDACSVHELVDRRAITVCMPGRERIAVFRYGRRISAVTNICAHQRGPLGEGKIVDGCITCPWHGWEYRPEDGRSPPPFQERIATFRVRIVGTRVQVDPRALEPGTPVEPALLEEAVCEPIRV
jgi:nitrite reductase/ring-hydroxylating ferredoxin subunit/DMSO/TMAO reductase YedYZ heme-binding membrane subunit